MESFESNSLEQLVIKDKDYKKKTNIKRIKILIIIFAILIIIGVQVFVIAILSELFSINRKLLEDIQRRLKLFELNIKDKL